MLVQLQSWFPWCPARWCHLCEADYALQFWSACKIRRSLRPRMTCCLTVHTPQRNINEAWDGRLTERPVQSCPSLQSVSWSKELWKRYHVPGSSHFPSNRSPLGGILSCFQLSWPWYRTLSPTKQCSAWLLKLAIFKAKLQIDAREELAIPANQRLLPNLLPKCGACATAYPLIYHCQRR